MKMRALGILLGATMLLGAEPVPSESPVPRPTPAITDPYLILSRAREIFHAHARPAFITYTLERREWFDEQPDADDSYTWRIWCRAADNAALSRLWVRRRNRAYFELHFIRPAFNEPVDPGPPTADIFVPAPTPKPVPQPTASERLRTIAVVGATGDLDYRAAFAGLDAGAYHLKLQPLRDRDRNVLRELWVDASTYELRRVLAIDKLFIINQDVIVPQRFDIHFEMQEGVPVIRRLDAVADVAPSFRGLGHHVEGQYFFDDIEFGTAMPGWYFEPKTYRAHFKEAPLR
jgi:hypothetical protein